MIDISTENIVCNYEEAMNALNQFGKTDKSLFAWDDLNNMVNNVYKFKDGTIGNLIALAFEMGDAFLASKIAVHFPVSVDPIALLPTGIKYSAFDMIDMMIIENDSMSIMEKKQGIELKTIMKARKDNPKVSGFDLSKMADKYRWESEFEFFRLGYTTYDKLNMNSKETCSIDQSFFGTPLVVAINSGYYDIAAMAIRDQEVDISNVANFIKKYSAKDYIDYELDKDGNNMEKVNELNRLKNMTLEREGKKKDIKELIKRKIINFQLRFINGQKKQR